MGGIQQTDTVRTWPGKTDGDPFWKLLDLEPDVTPEELTTVYHEVSNRLSTLEGALTAINRIEKKLDDLGNMAARMAGIEERHLNNSTAIERMFGQIERLDRTLREDHRTEDGRFDVAMDRVNQLEKELSSRVSWVRGAWFAAAILFAVIQAGVIWYAVQLDKRLEISENHILAPQHSHGPTLFRGHETPSQ